MNGKIGLGVGFEDISRQDAKRIEIIYLVIAAICYQIIPAAKEIEIFIYGLFDKNAVKFENLNSWLSQNTKAVL